MDCINDKAEHDPVTYGLIPGSYTALTDEDVYWANDAEGNGAYYVDITIEDENYDTYVTRYDTDTAGDETHTVVAGEDESKTITLKHEGGEWTVPTGAIPVTIDVACGTDPHPSRRRAHLGRGVSGRAKGQQRSLEPGHA